LQQIVLLDRGFDLCIERKLEIPPDHKESDGSNSKR
jgi:hypothetical protein